MLEVMITIFVLSVGTLGVAGLQLKSKRAIFEASQREIATLHLQELVERMRANPNQLTVYTNNSVGRVLGAGTEVSPTPNGSITSITCSAGCAPNQIAQFDLFEWEQSLLGVSEQVATSNVGGLTAPIACITGPAGGSGTYTVTIAWKGLTKLSDPTISTCGQGSGFYDSDTEDDVYRQVLVLQTFISEPI